MGKRSKQKQKPAMPPPISDDPNEPHVPEVVLPSEPEEEIQPADAITDPDDPAYRPPTTTATDPVVDEPVEDDPYANGKTPASDPKPVIVSDEALKVKEPEQDEDPVDFMEESAGSVATYLGKCPTSGKKLWGHDGKTYDQFDDLPEGVELEPVSEPFDISKV